MTAPNAENKRKGLRGVLKPQFMIDWVRELKEHGIKQFLRKKGWKVVVAFCLFYLIRDSFLYLLLPYLAAKGLLGC